MAVDLHTHSYFSDGDLSPRELAELAHAVGVKTIALTDHDTVAGLADMRVACDELTLKLITGVELSCSWRGQLLHVVGLGIDPENKELLTGITGNIQRREDRAQAMLQDFQRHGIDLKPFLISEHEQMGVLTRPHFADALVKAGIVKNKATAFKKYLVRGKPGFVPMQWPGIEDVGQWISKAGGIGVLAHPARYKMTRSKLCALVEEMLDAGIRGIEVSTSNSTPQQRAQIASVAREYRLLASIGSDFHSKQQPWARLGAAPLLPDDLIPIYNELVH